MEVLKSIALLLVLLNPFLLIIYLIDMVQKMKPYYFRLVLFRAGIISSIVFILFALLGDQIFSKIVQAQFASFQIFGGLVFFVIGLQFVFRGPDAIEILRGESEHIAGAIAMPVFIGPGTISASVLIGQRLSPILSAVSIFASVMLSIFIIYLLKLLHDYVRPRKEQLVQRYIEITGRITALFIGTISIEMIMQGIREWIGKF